MVRATAAEVVKLIGGSYPAGWDATSVGNLCPDADYALDGYVKKYYKTSLSTTDNEVISIANAIVVRKMVSANWVQGGSQGSEPVIFTQEIRDRIAAVCADTTSDGITYVKMQSQTDD